MNDFRLRFCGALAAFGLMMPAPMASAEPDSAARPALHVPFEEIRLANGLRVILAEDHRLPLIAANLRFFVGSANDPPGRTGFAHLFEHLYAFSTPREYPDLQGVGATQVGATTEPDRTTYYTTIPSSQLELLLALESDRWRHFPQRLDAALLGRERSNVRNERRLVIENEPYGIADEAMYRQLFPPGHPYRARYIGSHADIEAARLEEARQFFERYYVPGNASLVIAGDFDTAGAKALITRYLGSIRAGAPPPVLEVATPRIAGVERVTITDRIDLPRVAMAWLTPGWYAPGSVEAELLSVVLGSSTSRLRERLLHRRHLAQEIVAEYLPLAHASVLVIKATASPGTTLQDLERAIGEEVAVLRTEGPTAAEVEQARNTVELQVVGGLEKLGDIMGFGDFTRESSYGGVAEQLSQCSHLTGDPGCFARTLDRYHDATPATLQSFAAATLTRDASVVVYAVPGEKVLDDVPAAAPAVEPAVQPPPGEQRFVAPPAGPASAINLPVPRQLVLANGLTVLLAERHHLPIVTAHLVVRSGSGSSPPGRPGLAAFTLDMLPRGTGRRTAAQVAGAAAQLGATVATDISSDAAALGIRVLSTQLEPAIELLADLATHPTFPQQEVDRLRVDQRARLAQLHANADTLASYLFTRAIYGPAEPYRGSGLFNDDLFARAHRYGYDEFGTPESLQALTKGDLVDFWKRSYTPDNAALVVAGDITLAELRTIAERHLGAWSGKSSRTKPPRAATPPSFRIQIEDHGAASQTALRVGTVAAARSNPDLVALRTLNFIFGEIYASRITTNLRERHGYTYMARSQFAFRRVPGPFVIGTNVRTDVTAPALQELFNEMRRLRFEPVSSEDLRFARSAYTGSLIGLYETTGRIATGLGQLFTYDLPLGYYEALPRQIAAVTAGDVQRVAQRYLDPRQMVVVAVGDRSKIKPELRRLDLGAAR